MSNYDTHMQLKEATETWTKLASEVFNQQFDTPMVQCNVGGRIAGKASRGQWTVKYNPELYERNKVDFINSTVPHELSHLIAGRLFPGCQSHGAEWKHVMLKLGCNPRRCHSYDVSVVSTARPRPYTYQCRCMEHKVTRLMHDRIRAKGVVNGYKCKRCKSSIIFVG